MFRDIDTADLEVKAASKDGGKVGRKDGGKDERKVGGKDERKVGGKDVLDGFKKFVLRGNVIDLAVGIIIGAAFTAVVNSLVKDLITPVFGIFGGLPDFSAWAFTVNGSQFNIGSFINAVLSFLIMAGVLYWVIVVPVNRLMDLRKVEEAPETETRECPECLSKIPTRARRCPFCTARFDAAGVPLPEDLAESVPANLDAPIRPTDRQPS
jgi:large conductance mechanosensitive channel